MKNSPLPQPSAAYLLSLFNRLGNFLGYNASALRLEHVDAFERFLLSDGQNPWTTKPKTALIRVTGEEWSSVQKDSRGNKGGLDFYVVGDFHPTLISPSKGVKGLWETSTVWLKAGQNPETVLDKGSKADGWILAKPEHLIGLVGHHYPSSIPLYVFLTENKTHRSIILSCPVDDSQIELRLGHSISSNNAQALVVRKVKP